MRYFEFFRKLDKLSEDYLTEGKNLEKTIQMYLPRFKKAVKGFYNDEELPSDELLADSMKNLIALDPTFEQGSNFTGDYGTWILDRYIKDSSTFSGNEIVKVLKDFIDVKQSLPNKDINSYKTINDLRNAIDSVQLTNRQEQRRKRHSKDYHQVYEDNEWEIFVPDSFRGSCTLGSGTGWCTAYTENDDMYDYYSKNGTLYVIINKQDPSEKYQYFFGNENTEDEFRDSENEEVDKESFYEEFPNIYKFFVNIGKQYDYNKPYIYEGGKIPNNIRGEVKKVIVSESVTKIGKECFASCESLEQVTIPNSVIEIGNYCFIYCESLKQITIPNSVTKIGGGCFHFSALEQVTIPDSVTEISEGCFAYCQFLKQITIPDSVVEIGDFCFRNCYHLKQITIPNSVTKIGRECFRDCSALRQIIIPNSVVEIGNYCFRNCGFLEQITIPESVTEIGNYCFDNCRHLKQIRVKKGSYAHQYCIEEGLEDAVVFY